MNAPDMHSLLATEDRNKDEDEKKKDGMVAIKSATHFLKRGGTYTPVDASTLVVVETLPLGTYTVGASPSGFYFERIEDFELNGRIYGDTCKQAERILNTFCQRRKPTGALLEGEKGSGKSMTLKKISIDARALGMPTIVINTPFCGDSFNAFIQNLKQPAVVCFDEFEKVYDSDDQEKLLTILDGTFPTEKLFILTVNNKWRIDQHMRNRPGRIYYSLTFGGLSAGFISEYCQDNLVKNAEHGNGVLAVAAHFGKFTFDMLKALVEEMNRYGEPAAESMKWLNINPEDAGGSDYKITIFKDGKDVELQPNVELHKSVFSGNPLEVDDYTIYINTMKQWPDGTYRVENRIDVDFNEENIVNFDYTTATYHFTFPGRPGYTATMTRVPLATRNFNYF